MTRGAVDPRAASGQSGERDAAHLRDTAYENLASVATAVALLSGSATAIASWRSSGNARQMAFLLASGIAGVVAMLILRRAAMQAALPRAHAHAALGGAMHLLLGLVLIRWAVFGGTGETAFVGLALGLTGALCLSLPWLLSCVAVGLGGWAVIKLALAIAWPEPFAIMALLLGAVMALFMRRARLASLRLGWARLARLEDAAAAANGLLRAVTRAQSRYITSGNAAEVFAELLSDCLELTGSQYGFIGEIHDDTGAPYLKTYAITSIARDAETRELDERNAPSLILRDLDTLCGAVITGGATVIANSPANDVRRAGLPQGHPPPDAFLGLPLHHQGALVGMVGVANRPGGYDEHLVSSLSPFLGACASLIAALRDARVLAEARAREMQARTQMAATVESSDDAIVFQDLEGRIATWNAGAERLFGHAAAEVVDQPLSIIVPCDRRDELQVLHAAIERGEHPEPIETRRLAKDGRALDVTVRVSAVRDLTASLIGFSEIIRDVTERKRAEAALQASERRASTLLSVARDLAGTVDIRQLLDRTLARTAAVVRCDRLAIYMRDADRPSFRPAALWGHPARELPVVMAMEFADEYPLTRRIEAEGTITVDDPRALPAELVEQLGIRSIAAVALRVRGRFLGCLAAATVGEQRSFGQPQLELLEGIASYLAVAIEAAESYEGGRLEAEVSAAVARVSRELIASTGTPALLDRFCALTTEILAADGSMTLLWEREHEAFVPAAVHGHLQRNWSSLRVLQFSRSVLADWLARFRRQDVIHVDSGKWPTEVLAALAADMEVGTMLLIALRRGSELAALHAVCFRDPGRPLTSRDERIARGLAQVASLALANTTLIGELEQANRLRSEFIATMSHELRTPMNIILGYHALLLEHTFGALNEDQEDTLLRAERSARELYALINNTLDLSRLEAGRLAPDLRDVLLEDLLGDVETETRALSNPQVQLTCVTAPDLARVRTDPAMLKVVIKNLVVNALKFTERGSVRVEARLADSERVEISVSDTGIGIAADVLPVMFEAFRQGDTGGHSRGAGLGLFIVRRLLGLLGGTVSVESQPGRGSRFTVHVPRDPGG